MEKILDTISTIVTGTFCVVASLGIASLVVISTLYIYTAVGNLFILAFLIIMEICFTVMAFLLMYMGILWFLTLRK